MDRRRLGILGGTFNPVHNGHVALALFVRGRLSLERVLLVTARHPPHKAAAGTAPAEDRHRMVELACRTSPGIAPCDLELRRDGPSYTVLTLREIEEREPGADLFFIVGGDTIEELPTWYQLPEIISRAQVVTVTRPGFPERYREDRLPLLTPSDVERLNRFVLAMPPRHESSTEIRRRAAAGEPFEQLVPGEVARYIRERGLYGTGGER